MENLENIVKNPITGNNTNNANNASDTNNTTKNDKKIDDMQKYMKDINIMREILHVDYCLKNYYFMW